MLLAGSVLAANSPAGDGVIEGVVVRAVDQTPVPAPRWCCGRRLAANCCPWPKPSPTPREDSASSILPTDGACVYLPGANRDGIHYPGPSVRLSSLRPRAEVKLAVYDAVAFPNPLVVRRHTITLRPQPGVLQVTESMLIDNPSTACYVGQAAGEDAEPVTLQLAIPADFEQVTFASEFFGRRFSLIGGKLVTGVPWPPGQRELDVLLCAAQCAAALRLAAAFGPAERAECGCRSAAIRRNR